MGLAKKTHKPKIGGAGVRANGAASGSMLGPKWKKSTKIPISTRTVHLRSMDLRANLLASQRQKNCCTKLLDRSSNTEDIRKKLNWRPLRSVKKKNKKKKFFNVLSKILYIRWFTVDFFFCACKAVRSNKHVWKYR